MSATETSLASPSRVEDTPELIRDSTDALDTEMTCPLTLDHKEQTSTRSESPSKDEEMSSWQGRGNFAGFNHGTPNGNGNRYISPPNSSQPWQPNNDGSFNGQGFGFSPANNHSKNSAFYNNGPQYDPHTPLMNSNTFNNRSRASSMMLFNDGGVPIGSVRPGPVWPNDAQLDLAYAYCVRNNDGSVTRLIRADELQRFQGYEPTRQANDYGMIVLPCPRSHSPNSRNGLESLVPRTLLSRLPPNRIERPDPDLVPPGADPTQFHIDSIVASSMRSPPRREKIYCDKWIHEGVCAFTQMGCKYKHEMPTDKVTQVSLGLNHGLPNWYRRAYNIRPDGSSGGARLPSTSPESQENLRPRTDGNWRRLPAPPCNSNAGNGLNGSKNSGNRNGNNGGFRSAHKNGDNQGGARLQTMSASPASSSAGHGSAFGPIGPPSNSPFHNSSPFAHLKTEHEEEDEEATRYQRASLMTADRPLRPVDVVVPVLVLGGWARLHAYL